MATSLQQHAQFRCSTGQNKRYTYTDYQSASASTVAYTLP